MKIAMIGHKRIPSREGGIEIVVEELSTRLVQMGYSVTVYNRSGGYVYDKNADKEKQKLKEYKGIRIIRVPTPERKSLNAVVYSFIATMFALFGNYDVIHYHAEGPCAFLPIPHFFGIRTIATIHGLDWQRSKWGGFAKRFLKFGERCAARYADEVIVLSANLRQYFKDTYNRDTMYIPNGISNTELCEPDIISGKFGLEKNKYILYLGRLVPEKGILYLLEAYKRLDTDIKLVIAGGGSHSDEYIQAIKDYAKNDERVIMTGFVQGNMLSELYSNCYLYVLPSDVEGMPIGLLEALSYGCRCLVSNIPENKETCMEYAQYFKKSDVDDLYRKLSECIEHPEAFRSNEDIMHYCYSRFNWDITTSLYIDVILNVLRTSDN
ncbi:glycosyltransferase family 4 protein [Oribacterium sp. P6A1]|uniref:glycosyltransferase family 4 protein n=1 Tax=Oribacterium sp. P6A1 TaxID=1410612 RepID=UPI000565E943|nr:glycosyltransferase family 4 protein [Oribacterium sp. P6A1]